MTTAQVRTLIVVDVQNDFCEGGSLAIDGGNTVASMVRAVVDAAEYDLVIATKDHHIDPGDHFSATPDFVDSWPRHCVVGTPGEEFTPPIDAGMFDEIFRKGEYDAAYSGFEGKNDAGESLADWLRTRDIATFDLCGIATDVCVRATALDGVREGFDVTVLRSLTAAVAPNDLATTEQAFADAGVTMQ